MRQHLFQRRFGPRQRRFGPRQQVNPPVRPREPTKILPRRWLISVPVWGADFVRIFCDVALPRLRAAASQLGEPVTLIAHTNSPAALESIEQLPIVTASVPAGKQWFNRMSAAHADVISRARPGDIVVPLTADMVISENTLSACRAIFSSGKKLVCCNATRAVAERPLPERPTSRELSEWAWNNRHGIIRNCTWPEGQIEDVSRIYFARGPNVCCRLWLSHPLAVCIDGRQLPFGPTIDCNLVVNFTPEEVHLVTSPDELTAIELSPMKKPQGSRDADEPPARTDLGPLSARYGKGLQLNPYIYRWILSQRIVIAGTGAGCGDEEVVRCLVSG